MNVVKGRAPACDLLVAFAVVAACVTGCAGPGDPPILAAGSEVEPGAPCSADAVVPQVLTTQPASLSPEIFDRADGWESRLGFRVDERGGPTAIVVTMADTVDDDPRVVATREAFAAYRFCPPVAYSPATHWTAVLRYRPVVVSRTDRRSDTFIQMFIPAYTRDEVRAGRTGRAVVAGTFAQDGRPTQLRLVASTGDAVLDRKSLEAMASWQLTFRPGTHPNHPLVFEQPYRYTIR